MFAFGGVHDRVKVVLFGLLACALATVATFPDASLARAGRLRGWVGLAFAATLAMGTGLLPLPEGLRALVARDARTGWTLSSLDPERTISSLTYAWWLAGLGAATGSTAIVLARRRWVEWGALGLFVTVLTVATVHWFGGLDQYFGRIPVKIGGGFAAPFIDRSHFGSFLLLGFPLAVDWASDRERLRFQRLGAALAAVWALGMLFVVHAVAPLCLALGQLVFASIGRGRSPWPALATVPFVVGGVLVWSLAGEVDDGSLSLHGRLDMWRAGSRLLADHWLLGAGAGSFVSASQPYRTDFHFASWDHAHNDYLEALFDTGLVGVPVWLAGAVSLWPRKSRDPRRSRWIDLAVLGVLGHALVEFPLEVPALAGGAVALWAVRQGLHGEPSGRRPMSARAVRIAVVGLLLLQGVGGAWALRTEQVAMARLRLRETGWQAQPVKVLKWLAPWAVELELVDAWRAEATGNRRRAAELARAVATRHPADPEALQEAAAVLGRAGERDEAEGVARQAVALAPFDWRHRVLLAILVSMGEDPDAAVKAWQDALRAGAPARYYASAWRVAPVGLVWIDAVADLPTRFHASLGAFLVRRGDLDSAALVFEQALLRGGGEEQYPEYADLLLAQGRLREAEEYVLKVLSARPRNREFRVRLAKVREAQEQWSEAADLWEALAVEARGVKEAPARAVICAEKAGGAKHALEMVRRLRLSRVATAAVTLEEARILLAQGEPGRCVDAILATGDIDDERLGRSVRRALEKCRAARSAAELRGRGSVQQEEEGGEEGEEGHPVP